MKKTTIREIRFNGSEKAKIRDFILDHAQKGKAFLDLYGNGECYRLAKNLGINILSIDDGRDFKNGQKLKIQLKGKDKMFINLKDLCNSGMKRNHDVMWLDYCGAFSKDVKDTIPVLPKIMAKKGVLFITLLCGRENLLPKGTDREVIDSAVLSIIKKHFRITKVKVTPFFKKSYLSKPKYGTRKKKAATRMIVHGLTWEKLSTN